MKNLNSAIAILKHMKFGVTAAEAIYNGQGIKEVDISVELLKKLVVTLFKVAISINGQAQGGGSNHVFLLLYLIWNELIYQ